jgi:signal transduction histidine kinase
VSRSVTPAAGVGCSAPLDAIPSRPRSATSVVEVDGNGRFRLTDADWILVAPGGDLAAVEPAAGEPFGIEMSDATAYYEECVATRRAVAFDVRHRDGTSEARWHVVLTPLHDGDGPVRRIVGVALDLADGRQIAHRLANMERQFASIAGILAADITDLERRVEPPAIRTTADQRDAFFGDVARSLVVGIGCRWAGLARLSEDGSRAETLAWFDRDVRQPDIAYSLAGTPCADVIAANGFLAIADGLQERYPDDRWLADIGARSYVGEVVRGVDGRPAGHVFGIGDAGEPDAQAKRFITTAIAARVGFEMRRLEVEAQLRSAKEAAECASRMKTQFLANMSHELRTPLNAIIGFSQMIRDEFRGPAGCPEYKDYAGDIHDSSCHLLQIINDLLDVSKIEAGMLTLHESEVDIGHVVEACCRLVKHRADEARVTLAVEMPQPAPILRADDRMLRQIALNLLSNAVKFTPAGGSVAISVTVSAAGEVALAVRDTGIGIAPENFEKVMQPFGQIDGALTRRCEGTGLGLPLTRGLVRLHGGTLTLASELGIGTTVTVRLPGRLVGNSRAA